MFAEIIIPLALPKNYTWSVPERYAAQAQPGVRVEVNLGANRKYAGIIKRLHNEKPVAFEPKEIISVIDTEPVIYEQQLKLWEWIASYYMCSEGEVMAAALPAHFKLSSETILVYNEEYGDDFSALDHDEYLVAEALLLKKELRLPEVQQLLDSQHVYPLINSLIAKKVCYVWEALKKTYAAKKETYVQLHADYLQEDKLEYLLNNWNEVSGRAPKQLELLLAYLHISRTEGDVSRSALLKKSGASDAALRGLVDKNILELEKREVGRLPMQARNISIDFTLDEKQEEVFRAIKNGFSEKQVSLLHGVTSSGKTLVYIRLIEEVIKSGRQVLYMLPEIALTAQIIRRLQKHFGGYAGVYHSKFSQNERVELWNKVKSGEISVILGARSSLFLPYRDLGLVICDEEQDSSFKQQEPAPRYHGRDAAIYCASLYKGNVLLGSATPSMETYFNAVSGKYGHYSLQQRYGEFRMPPIRIIDTRNIREPDRTRIMLTPELKDTVAETLKHGRQVILFQNRRGYSPYQVCRACGWIPQCRNCDVSLTYHKLNNKLACHYCGTQYPPLQTCAACGSHDFVQRSFGTEKIEEQLVEAFPGARVARMDMDTIKGKHAHEQLIHQFEQQRIDILVGTQMVVKGLDFDHVDLVGILDADALLNFADFRVNERGFQLMEQVSGRAGRKNETGQVLVQAANISHPVLQFVQRHDYIGMYNQEISKRKIFGYPPFTRIIHLYFRHRDRDIVRAAAASYAQTMMSRYGKYMVGPAEPVIPRIRNLYRMELMFKLPKNQQILKTCKRDILSALVTLHQDKRFRSVVMIPDVDPV